MKLRSLILLAVLGFGLAACEKNTEVDNGIEGPLALSLKIVNPVISSKVAEATTANTIAYDKVKVKLTATAGGFDWKEIAKNDLANTIFYDVENPTLLEVAINGGESMSFDLVKGLAPANMAAYGKVGTFTRERQVVNGGKTYDLYKASVEVKIPVARFEVSGITHAAHATGKECEYKTLTLSEVYFAGVNTTPVAYPYTTAAAGTDTLREAVTGGDQFLTAGTVFPSGGGFTTPVYAFNMYKSTDVPKLKFKFTGATAKQGQLNEVRYAVVKKFQVRGNDLTALEPGKVYSIKSVAIADESISGDEEGNTLIAVNVELTVQDWGIEDTEVVWK